MKNFYFILIVIGAIASCTSKVANSTSLDSEDIETSANRVSTLQLEIKSFSEFQDAEFELFNVNGFHNQREDVPGASSWDYKFVIKIDPRDISKWTEGMEEIKGSAYDDSWTKEIIKHRQENWKTHSTPQHFIREGGNIKILFFKDEGILFKRGSNL